MKKKKPLLLLVFGFLLTTAGVYFLVKKPGLKPDFLYTALPSIAGVSTSLLNNARSVIPTGVPVSNLFSSVSADPDNPILLQQLNDEVKARLDNLKNSLIETGLKKIGYTPVPKEETSAKSGGPTPCNLP